MAPSLKLQLGSFQPNAFPFHAYHRILCMCLCVCVRVCVRVCLRKTSVIDMNMNNDYSFTRNSHEYLLKYDNTQ